MTQTWPAAQNLPDANYWNNMAAWLFAVCAYVNANWPITVYMIQLVEPFGPTSPIVDPNTGLNSISQFLVESPNLRGTLISVAPGSYLAFIDSVPTFAAVLVSQLANNAGINPPAPNQASVPAPVVRTPASNPVGPSFEAGNGVTGYTNLNAGPNSLPVGAQVNQAGIDYVLVGVPSMFGAKTYWEVAA